MRKELFTNTFLNQYKGQDKRLPVGTIQGCSIKVMNMSQYGLSVFRGQEKIDYVPAYQYLVLPNENDYVVELDEAAMTDYQHPASMVTVKSVEGVKSYTNGSILQSTTQAPGSVMNVAGDVNVGNILQAEILAGKVEVEGEVKFAPGQTVEIGGNPTVNLAPGQKVSIEGTTKMQVQGDVTIGNTPNVQVANTSLQVTNTPGGNLTVAGTVEIGNTPEVTVSSGTVNIGNTPQVSIAPGSAVQIASGKVEIAGTPGVQVSNTSIPITNVPGGQLSVAGTVQIGNTPAVNIANTPTVQLAGTNTVNIGNTPKVELAGGTVNVASGQITVANTPGVNVMTRPNASGEAYQGKIYYPDLKNQSNWQEGRFLPYDQVTSVRKYILFLQGNANTTYTLNVYIIGKLSEYLSTDNLPDLNSSGDTHTVTTDANGSARIIYVCPTDRYGNIIRVITTQASFGLRNELTVKYIVDCEVDKLPVAAPYTQPWAWSNSSVAAGAYVDTTIPLDGITQIQLEAYNYGAAISTVELCWASNASSIFARVYVPAGAGQWTNRVLTFPDGLKVAGTLIVRNNCTNNILAAVNVSRRRT